MNLSAFVAIAIFCVVLSLLVYLPARWLLTWKSKNGSPTRDAQSHVTPAGFAYTALVVGILFIGFSQQHLAPQTAFGQFVGTGLGSLAFTVGMIGIAVVLGMVLEMLGFTLFRPPNDSE
jgi:hypothetical protein